ncbi:hypothetical protein CROQUDRAFT_50415 [Cronartium quercuum f. sp. fusiforme G11]|uniref:Serine/threonine-protein phosphatase 2A activator n=1 Tax=Cronartium quercuum f. sp. fusiforme G11 TaxID=708437 RepID=A0A9P6N9A7_9BASI|nr:hypothetical protein CROQUDRAFT_50415 [Cronartium quercuum f. sp. fusiforme G11]
MKRPPIQHSFKSEPRPTYDTAVPYVDPFKLKGPLTPTKRVLDQSDLAHLFECTGLSRVLSVLMNMSQAVAEFGLTDDDEKRDRLSQSTSLWIIEIPLDCDPQRFGNKAFKVWGQRLEDEAEALHRSILGTSHQVIMPELLHHFKTAFGSFVRLDYGTGHELSFLAYLSILHLTRLLTPKDLLTTVLVIYQRYFDTCRKLQEVYRLEPAGSKGVYGLDDHFHLVYIFGSAQLLHQSEITPSMINDRNFIAPQSSLFFNAIAHIRKLKRGPFFEHSPILYNVGKTVTGWTKVHSGMIKMWKGEVLGKVQVMQHFWFTDHGVLGWNLGKEEEECFFLGPEEEQVER